MSGKSKNSELNTFDRELAKISDEMPPVEDLPDEPLEVTSNSGHAWKIMPHSSTYTCSRCHRVLGKSNRFCPALGHVMVIWNVEEL